MPVPRLEGFRDSCLRPIAQACCPEPNGRHHNPIVEHHLGSITNKRLRGSYGQQNGMMRGCNTFIRTGVQEGQGSSIS